MSDLNLPNSFQDRLKKEILTKSFHQFFIWSFKILLPTDKYVDNFHVKYLCDLLQAEVERIERGEPKTKDLIINIPPRTSKSIIISVCFHAWAWIRLPNLRFITVSYDDTLALKNAQDTKKIIQSQEYQNLFGDLVELDPATNSKELYQNLKGGARLSKSTGNNITGFGAEFIILDDPQNPGTASQKIEREKTIDYYRKALYNRLTPIDMGVRIIVQQRLHVEDLTGYLIENSLDKYIHINLPAELPEEGSEYGVKPPELADRYVEGLLDPNRLNKETLQDLEDTLLTDFSGQYLQNPISDGGNIFKSDWIKIVPLDMIPSEVLQAPTHFFIDTSYGDTKNSDYTAIMACSYINNQLWVKEIKKGRYGFHELVKFIIRFVGKHNYNKDESMIYVEPKASGMSIVDEMINTTLLNIVKDKAPKDPKEVRAKSTQMIFQTGRVNFIAGEWNKAAIDELTAFPKAKYDDVVDVCVMAVKKFFHQIKEPFAFLNINW